MSWPVLPPGRSGATWANVGACFLASILKADVEIAPMHSHPPGSDRDATRDLGRPVFGSPVGSILLAPLCDVDRKSTRLNSSHLGISYAVFCLKKNAPGRHASCQRRSTQHSENALHQPPVP